MGLVVLTGWWRGGLLLKRTDQLSRELIDNIQPARVRPTRCRRRCATRRPRYAATSSPPTCSSSTPYYAGQARREAGGGRRPAAGRRHAPSWSPIWMPSSRPRADWRTTYAEPVIAEIAPGRPAAPSAPTRARQGRIRPSANAFRPQNENLRRRGPTASSSSTDMRRWRDGLVVAMLVVFVAGRRCWRLLVRSARHPPTVRPRRGVPPHQPRAIPRTHHAARAAETSAPSRPTSRTCGSGSSTNSMASRAATDRARRSGRGAAAVQRRTGAVRLRRLARPAGAAAQGRVVLPASREALRRPTRRARDRVHRFRRRRRQANAGAHQRPAHLLPGRAAQRHRHRGRPRRALLDRRSATSRRRSRSPAPRSSARAAAADSRRRPDAADDAVAEPDRQRGEVPARRRRRRDRHRMRAGHGDRRRLALQRVRQRHRHRRRSSPTRSSSSSSGCTAATRIPAPASAWRCARRSSSITAAPSGSTRPTAAGTRVQVHPARHPYDRTQRDPPALLEGSHDMTSDTSSHRRPAGRGRPGRRADHPGSVRAQQDQQQPARRARRRGGPGLPVPARCTRGRAAAGPDPARSEPAEVRRPAAAGADQVRRGPVPHPGRGADHLVGRGGHPARATSCTPTPTSPSRSTWTSS